MYVTLVVGSLGVSRTKTMLGQLGVELYTIIWVTKVAVVNIIPSPVPMWTGCVVNALDLNMLKVLAGWYAYVCPPSTGTSQLTHRFPVKH